jgi:TRAP-type mannitol/chloroaromatic compound transport system permease small subunit
MRRTVFILDTISQWSGRIVCVFCFTLVLLLTYEVFMRYILSSPTIFSYEVSSMMGVTIGAGGLAYTHLHHGHVRVDVFWRLLSPRGKAIADLISSIIFFYPLIIVMTYISAEWAWRSFVEGEIMATTYLYPPAWPVRFVMTLGFFMFIPQGISRFIRDIYISKGTELPEIGHIKLEELDQP